MHEILRSFERILLMFWLRASLSQLSVTFFHTGIYFLVMSQILPLSTFEKHASYTTSLSKTIRKSQSNPHTQHKAFTSSPRIQLRVIDPLATHPVVASSHLRQFPLCLFVSDRLAPILPSTSCEPIYHDDEDDDAVDGGDVIHVCEGGG